MAKPSTAGSPHIASQQEGSGQGHPPTHTRTHGPVCGHSEKVDQVLAQRSPLVRQAARTLLHPGRFVCSVAGCSSAGPRRPLIEGVALRQPRMQGLQAGPLRPQQQQQLPYTASRASRSARSICCSCSLQRQGPGEGKPQAAPQSQPKDSLKHVSRRTALLSIAPPLLVLPDLGAAVRTEASLWGQELQLYGRQLQQGLGLGKKPQGPQQPMRPKLDTRLAETLLQVPALAARTAAADGLLPGWDEDGYELAFERIKAQELKYFKELGACGACGEAGLSDAAYVDFLSYCQFKALAPQLTGNRAAGSTGSPVGSSTKSSMASIYDYMHRGSLEYYSALEREGEEGGEEAGSAAPGPAAAEAGETEAALPTPPLPLQAGVETPGFRTTPMPAPPAAASITPLSAMQRRMGRLLLEWVEGNLLEGPAKEVVAARTAQLDVIRVGVRSILEALQGAGFMGSFRLEQLGLSKDEYENHEVWVSGEPAFVKVTLTSPLTLRSGGALQSEEGFSQDFLFLTLSAYLERCGVAASTLRRFPSLTDPSLVAEQFTAARLVPTTEQPTEEEATLLRRLPPFALAVCQPDIAPTCV